MLSLFTNYNLRLLVFFLELIDIIIGYFFWLELNESTNYSSSPKSLKGFSDFERSTYKSIVFNNIVHSMATLLKAMKSLQINFDDDSLAPISEKFFQEAESNFNIWASL